MDGFERRMVIGGFLFAAGMVLDLIMDAHQVVQLAVFLSGYILVGYDVILTAARNIRRGQFLDENFLMLVATVGAFIIGEYPEGLAVMLFFQIGEWFEKRAVNRTRQSITDLMNIQPEFANLIRDGSMERVSPEDVSVGDMIAILPGERIPLDGKIVSGASSVDTKALTGESMPRDVGPGDRVVSGTVNLSSKIVVDVERSYDDSTVTRILELVEDSVSRKAPAERFITKFARYYTPAVVVCAMAVAIIPIALGYDAGTWVYRALTFLVVSCPCALVISVPLSYFCGIGAGSKMGILIKGGNYLEALAHADTVVFDKTGTLTEGRFEVSQVHSESMDGSELVRVAAEAESFSNHPISLSLRRAHGKDVDPSIIGDVEEIPGRGVRAVIGGSTVHVGNGALMGDIGVEHCTEEVSGTNVHVARDGEYLGHVVVSDVIKSDAEKAVADLRACGIGRTVMLSGDSRAVCEEVGRRLGIDRIECELLPADKMRILEEIMDSETERGRVVFVGDGINDAPSLARADVGIAMGGLGSDAAIEAADVVIMDDSPSKVPISIRLAKRTNRIVMENIVFALAVKFSILALAVIGYADMWAAVFGDVGVSVIAILNAMRCLRTESYLEPSVDSN